MFRSFLESVIIHLVLALAVTAVVYSGVKAVSVHKKPETKTVVLLTSMVNDQQKTNKPAAGSRIKIPDKPMPAVRKHTAVQKKTPDSPMKKQEPRVPPVPNKTPAPVPVPAQVTAPKAAPVVQNPMPEQESKPAEEKNVPKNDHAQTANANGAASEDKRALTTGSASGGNQIAQENSGKLAGEYSGKNFNYILALVKSNLKYPYIAKVNRWSGRTVVQFDISHDGSVSNIKIISSSGHDILDERVKDAVNDSAPFPHPPVPATIVIPVSFSLIG